MKQFLIQIDKSIKTALKKFTDVSSNTLIVVNKNQSYLGTISNGDVRKAILKNADKELVDAICQCVFNMLQLTFKLQYFCLPA